MPCDSLSRAEAAAEAALPSGGQRLNAAFVTGTHTLWYDINNDHLLDGRDLGIVLVGVDALVPQDVRDGAVIG